MLLTHCARRAASRAAWTAGRSRPIRTAMMAMTTSSSISVNPRRIERPNDECIGDLHFNFGHLKNCTCACSTIAHAAAQDYLSSGILYEGARKRILDWQGGDVELQSQTIGAARNRSI